MSSNEVDILIIGGGPAGLTAGLYTSRARLNTIIIEKTRQGGQIATSKVIENWPGTIRSSGTKLTDAMAEHAKHFGCSIVKGEIAQVEFSGYGKSVFTVKGEEYIAKAVIIASGAEPRVLGIEGEREFRGRGVSYCATCDAEFYTDASVVVIGNGDAAVEEALYLTEFAREVVLVVVHDEGVLDATKVIQERAFANPRISFRWNSMVTAIKGDDVVNGVVIKNIKTGALELIETDGVFFFVGIVPSTSFLKGKVEMDAAGYIITDDMMATSADGVYAAGDCRQKILRQVVTAVADGAVAAVMAEKYIREEELFRKEILEQEKPVLLVLWSPLLEASIPVVKAVEGVQERFGDKIKVTKIDTYRNQRVAGRYQVREIPTVLVMKGGEVMARVEEFDEEVIAKTVKSFIE